MHEGQRIAIKVSRMRPSLTLALKAAANERRAQGLPVYDFGLGETKGELHPRVRDAGIKAFQAGDTMYADPSGIPELRQAVLEWLGIEGHYTPRNVIVSAGAKQSLFNIFLSLCNPGDVVLFESAPWVSYEPLALAATAAPVLVISKKENRLKVQPDELLRNLKRRPHARMFLLNSPCNPTAQLYSRDEVAELVRICAEHQVYFVLDRLYWRIVFDGESYPEPPIDEQTKPWLIQVDGLSKNWRSTGGLRIGWSIAPDDVSDAMSNLQSHYTSGASVPAQRAALAALEKPYPDEMVKDLELKRNLLQKHAVGMAHVDVWPTPASFYSFWDVSAAFGRKTPDGRVLNSSDDVAAYLASEGVLTASGTGFFQEGYLRLSFAAEEDQQVIDGVEAAKRAFAALR